MDTITVQTAAGPIEAFSSFKSAVRGGTMMYFGILPDGRYVVASRWQVEIRTKKKEEAHRVFRNLTKD